MMMMMMHHKFFPDVFVLNARPTQYFLAGWWCARACQSIPVAILHVYYNKEVWWSLVISCSALNGKLYGDASLALEACRHMLLNKAAVK
jgi:hypothetical protein